MYCKHSFYSQLWHYCYLMKGKCSSIWQYLKNEREFVERWNPTKWNFCCHPTSCFLHKREYERKKNKISKRISGKHIKLLNIITKRFFYFKGRFFLNIKTKLLKYITHKQLLLILFSCFRVAQKSILVTVHVLRESWQLPDIRTQSTKHSPSFATNLKRYVRI